MKKKTKTLVVICAAAVGVVIGFYFIATSEEGGQLERQEISGLPSYISVDPWSDLLTSSDVPSNLTEDTQSEFEFYDNYWRGIPYDHTAWRNWENSLTDAEINLWGTVCPTEADARNFLSEFGEYVESWWKANNPTVDISHTSFPLYGEERESFKVTSGVVGYGYAVNFRVQNVVV